VAEAELAIAHGVDALGLVGAMPSGPGVIEDKVIAEVAAMVPPPVASFLLTSECEAEAIADHALRTGVNTVQVVSHITPEESEKLAGLLPTVRRVQVIHVEGQDALELIDVYAPHVHAFLLDSGRPSQAILGGTGQCHDWSVSAEFVRRSARPVFLAGGLTPANVGEAVRTVRPYGLDLCSSLRIDGRLDAGLLDAFVGAVREADGQRSG
jgi:phosphoribosylanthranilate isomerase